MAVKAGVKVKMEMRTAEVKAKVKAEVEAEVEVEVLVGLLTAPVLQIVTVSRVVGKSPQGVGEVEVPVSLGP